MFTRRNVLTSITALLGLSFFNRVRAKTAAGQVHDSTKIITQKSRHKGYTPVKTLNGTTLPYKMKNGVKEFHLIAEEVEHEFAPGSTAKCWGYNGNHTGADHRSRGRGSDTYFSDE